MFCKKGQREGKSEFATKSRNYSYNYFHVKISLKLLVKPLLYRQCFLTDHLNHKNVNKTTCRTPIGKLVQKLSNCCDYFSGLSEFPDLCEEVLLITFIYFLRLLVFPDLSGKLLLIT